MALFFILALFTLPVLEIISIVQVSNWIGLLPTILLLCISAAIGFSLIRSQSIFVGQKFMQAVGRGEPPTNALINAVFLNLAGLLLIIPGFFTDAIALFLMLSPVRNILKRAATGQALARFRRYRQKREDARSKARPSRETVIDVEFTEVKAEDNPSPENKKNSPWRNTPKP